MGPAARGEEHRYRRRRAVDEIVTAEDAALRRTWEDVSPVQQRVLRAVAAVAVVVSLVYVGKELQRNTASIRAASIDDMSTASASLLLTVASDSALSRIRQIGDQDPSRLTEAEAYRYHTLMRQVYLTMQNVYFQNELETIDPRVWSVYQRVICTMRSNPGPRSTWSIHRPGLDSAFTALVESCPGA